VLRRRVDELRASIEEHRGRLHALADELLHRSLTASPVRIVHEDAVGAPYRLAGVALAIDGQPAPASDEPAGQGRRPLFHGTLAAGRHVVSLELAYTGHGGPFTYLEGYTYRVRSSSDLLVPGGGKPVLLEVRTVERGNRLTQPFERTVRIELHTRFGDAARP
jgi:hypothetical protein